MRGVQVQQRFAQSIHDVRALHQLREVQRLHEAQQQALRYIVLTCLESHIPQAISNIFEQ